eukprot:scaffold9931_cov62-Isochrysis_galbana.AAC.1
MGLEGQRAHPSRMVHCAPGMRGARSCLFGCELFGCEELGKVLGACELFRKRSGGRRLRRDETGPHTIHLVGVVTPPVVGLVRRVGFVGRDSSVRRPVGFVRSVSPPVGFFGRAGPRGRPQPVSISQHRGEKGQEGGARPIIKVGGGRGGEAGFGAGAGGHRAPNGGGIPVGGDRGAPRRGIPVGGDRGAPRRGVPVGGPRGGIPVGGHRGAPRRGIPVGGHGQVSVGVGGGGAVDCARGGGGLGRGVGRFAGEGVERC